MSSQHRLNGTTVRPEPDELDAARPHLAGRSLESALRALLRAVAAEPQRSLDLLAPYWPPDRPRGRPRKDTAGVLAGPR